VRHVRILDPQLRSLLDLPERHPPKRVEPRVTWFDVEADRRAEAEELGSLSVLWHVGRLGDE